MTAEALNTLSDERIGKLLDMAEKQNSLSMSKLAKELKFEQEEELEEFLIDAIRNKTINGKIDAKNDQFIVSSFQHRTFERHHWELLHVRLSALLKNFKQTHQNLKELVSEEK